MNNQNKFAYIRQLALPIDQYAITGSGPLGIRSLREIDDIDIIVNEDLWNTLAIEYGIFEKNGVKIIKFPNNLIEALGEASFAQQSTGNNISIAHRIAKAEIIDGLPFECLEYTIFFKKKMGREKDLNDILLLEAWQNK